MRIRFDERRLTLIGLSLGLLVLIGLASYAFNRKLEQSTHRENIRELRAVVEDILSLQSYLWKAESGQRGFLLTHDPQYLSAYHFAVEKLPSLMTRLEQETSRDPLTKRHVDNLRLLTEREFAELRTALDIAQKSPSEATPFVRSNTDKLMMVDVTSTLTALLDRQYEQLEVADRRERQASEEASHTIIGGAVLALILVGAGTYRVIRDKRSQEQADRLTEQARLLNLAPIMTRELDGRVLSWSDGYAQLCGWSQEDAVGRISHDLLQTHFPQALSEIQAILLRDGQWIGELEHTRKNGASIVVSATWTLLKERGQNPPAVVEVNTDISELKAAQIAQAQSEARFRLLADNMSQFAWIADEKGRVTWYNQRWFDYTGTTLPEMEGWGWKKVHHPDHVARVVEKIGRCFETGEIWEDTFPLRGRDGQFRWFLSRAIPIRDRQGHILQWFGTNTDITQLYEADQALRAQTAFARSILNSLPARIAVLDRQGVIIQVNNAWEHGVESNRDPQLLRSASVGADYLKVVRTAATFDEQACQILEGIAGVLAGTLPTFETTYSCPSPSTHRWFHLAVAPLHTPAGGAVMAHVDITARKEAEASQAFLASIVSTSPDAILSKSLDGQILTWNRGAEGLFGFSGEDLIGQSIDRLVPDELRAEEQQLRNRIALGTQVEQFETQRLHRSGRLVDVSISMSPILDDTNTIVGIAQIIRDISISKEAQQTLKRSEQFRRALFESSPDCVKVLSQEGRLLLMNSGGLCAMDIDDFETVRGKTWSELWPSEYRKTIEASLESARSGLPTKFRGYCPTTRGQPRWWDVTVTPVNDASGRTLVVSRDITDQRQAEEALRVSELRFRTLTTNIPQLVWSCQPDGTCDYLSDQWLTYTGTTLEQNLGYGWLALIHPDDVPVVDRGWKESVASGSPFTTEYRLRAADGTYHWQLARATPLRNKEGQIDVWFGTTTDISAQKESETTLTKINSLLEAKGEALAAANKELEAFSYSVSHDLRAPLRTMTGFAQALLEDYGEQLEPEASRYLKIISSGARQMGRLIDDLLSFSRLSRQSLAVSSISLAELVGEIRDELTADQAGRTIQWEIADLPICLGDRTTIKLVLANLLGNALKYTRTREIAKIQVGWQADDPDQRLCRLFVRDNGVGFDMRYADKLFTVFQRLHRADEFDGTGVGLAIVQRIVHRHGGRVWAEGRTDEGATFWFTLEKAS